MDGAVEKRERVCSATDKWRILTDYRRPRRARWCTIRRWILLIPAARDERDETLERVTCRCSRLFPLLLQQKFTDCRWKFLPMLGLE